jgi:hypothetical protein
MGDFLDVEEVHLLVGLRRSLRGLGEFLPTGILALSFGFSTSEFFEALDDNVAVQRVELHQEASSAGLLRGNER